VVPRICSAGRTGCAFAAGGRRSARQRLLGRHRFGVGLPGALDVDEAVYDFWLALDGVRRQGVLRVPAQRSLACHAPCRREEPHGDGWHRECERPAGRRGHQDERVDPVRVVHGQFLSHHAAQAHAHNVGSADTRIVEHGDDITSHVRDAERPGRQVAQSDSPVVHQYKPEMPPQLPRYRLPSVAVESHPLDQNQPWPLPVQLSTELVGDSQLTVRGVARPHSTPHSDSPQPRT
jgi:hypothetical protein